MMAVQVVGYVDESLKKRMLRLKQRNRRYSESRQIDEALAAWLPNIEATMPAPEIPVKKKSS